MLLATTDELPGFEIVEVLGLVRGNAVRVRHLGVDILAGFRNLVGGEVRGYTKMLAETREQALDRLRAAALARGADAVVGVRVTTSMVMQGAAEILCYGTAVRVRRTEGV
ncbi:MAG: YbjQ family protein [Deltaproteobacteria bacterium]|nr:MAG: YbjQ family protein [Deltaproteobacteria bacterium]